MAMRRVSQSSARKSLRKRSLTRGRTTSLGRRSSRLAASSRAGRLRAAASRRTCAAARYGAGSRSTWTSASTRRPEASGTNSSSGVSGTSRTRGETRAGARDLEPRLQQIFGPLVSVIRDASERSKAIAYIAKVNEDLVEERSEAAEAQALQVIRDLVSRGPKARLAIQDITREFVRRYGDEYERRVTPRWVGSLVRRRLGLKPSRSTGIFTLGPEEVARLASLYKRFGIKAVTEEQAEQPSAAA